MHKNGAVLTIACVMLCLTFNYTFPLRRESSKWNIFTSRNGSQPYCVKNHHENEEPMKKMAAQAHTEKADPIKENRKSKKKTNCPELNNNDEDLRHFEQMVIKKKNPYLDLKELELRYYNPKNTRQSVDQSLIGQDPSICEPLDDGPNVEITNRGLSGFAIPSKLLKGTNIAETKSKLDLESPNTDDSAIKTIAKISKKQSDRVNRDFHILNTLQDDIRKFEENKDAKIL